VAQIARPVHTLGNYLHRVMQPGASDPARLYFACAKFVVPIIGVVLAGLAAFLILQDDGSSITAGFAVFGVLVVTAVVAMTLLMVAVSKRVNAGYEFYSAQFWFDPKQIRIPMRSIFDSAEAICASQACTDGLLDGAAVHDAVYAAALAAADARHIRSGLKHANTSRKNASSADGQAALSVIHGQLIAIDDDLRSAAKSAARLSNQLPLRQPPDPVLPRRSSAGELAAVRAQELADQRRIAEVAAMEGATRRVKAREPRTDRVVSEQFSGVADGYVEAARITERVLRGPDLDEIASRNSDVDAGPVGATSGTDAVMPPIPSRQRNGSVVNRFQVAVRRSRTASQRIKEVREGLHDTVSDASETIARSRSNIANIGNFAKRGDSGGISGPSNTDQRDAD
jgi:hypothetical protein